MWPSLPPSQSTGMVRSFYIIHPDWNSEVGGHRRLRSSAPRVETPRIQASLSAQEALRERLIPLLQKKTRLSRPLPEGLSVYLLGVRDGYKQAKAISYWYNKATQRLQISRSIHYYCNYYVKAFNNGMNGTFVETWQIAFQIYLFQL